MRIRTGYSWRYAIGSVTDVIARLKAIGWHNAPICDRLSTFGFVRWTRAAQRAGLNVVYGTELPVIDAEGRTDWWSFFAMEDLKALHALIHTATAAAKDGGPVRLTYYEALASNALIKITGNCVNLDLIEPCRSGLFVPLAPSTPVGLVRQALNGGHDFIATSDNVYCTADQRELYRAILGQRANAQSYSQHIMDDDEWVASVEHLIDPPHIKRALDMRNHMLEQYCHAVSLKRGSMLKPQTSYTLRGLCEIGAQRLKIDLLTFVNGESYGDRLDRELKVIEEKNFTDYFLILSDMMQFARERMIVGPARGSSAGSLVCYLTGITSIDPLKWQLLFERFLDVTRSDYPDIDVDMADQSRTFDYVASKYGSDRVAHLGTVIQWRPRSLLNQIGKALKIPKWEIEQTADGVIERTAGDERPVLRESFETTTVGNQFIAKWPEVNQFATLEGYPNTAGQHAAGLIITEEPISDYVAVDARTNVAMIDKVDAEALGLLKIDALGLKQLTVFERTMELIGTVAKSDWLEQLPLDDPTAFAVLNQKHYSGVFQFNGKAQQQLAEQITFDRIDDIVAITALGRPGPMSSGAALTWIMRRNGHEQAATVHPKLTELTKDTYGVLVYQEQIMQVVREIGGLPWEDVTAIRKAIAKSMGDAKLESYRQAFCDGAVTNGIEPQAAEAVWRQIATMGSYCFNKSHAVAYAMHSYWCLWFKAHHPVEFAAATLDGETDPERQLLLLRELEAEGISYQPVDIKHSTDRWTPLRHGDGKQVLLGPLTSIKSIGPATVQEIMQARQGIKPLSEGTDKLLKQGVTEIGSLYPIRDAIAKACPSLADLKIYTTPTPCADIINGDVDTVVVGVVDRLVPYDENEAARVHRRNGKRYSGPTTALNIFLRDDSGSLLCRVDRFSYDRLATKLLDTAKAGKTLYAFKGKVPPNFKMLIVNYARLLGEIKGKDAAK